MKKENFPNFFIIGAAKSGTTALYGMLDPHPQVYLPYQKEPNFFSNDTNFAKGLDWYVDRYFRQAGNYPARGEASPQYLNWGDKVSARLAALENAGEIRLIAMFRDPVKRAYSHYWMLVHREIEKLSFEDALEVEQEKLSQNYHELEKEGRLWHGYFRGGQYFSLLKPYLERFAREQFHFVVLDDLKDNFSGVMQQLAAFLEIDDGFEFKQVVSNSAYVPRNQKLHHFLHYPSGPVSTLMRTIIRRTSPVFQYRLRRKIVELNNKSMPNPPMDENTARMLRERYLPEIESLEKILGRSLDQWKVPDA